jgi:hypothetical protein
MEVIIVEDINLINDKTETKIDISGIWSYEIDPEDIGIRENWFNKRLKNDGFKLPGTTNENKVGSPLDMKPVLDKDTVRSLRAHYQYIGAAWYQREFTVPAEWKDRKIVLFLEKIIEDSTLWIDGNEVGVNNSLSTPHIYDISNYICAGEKQTLTIRIDNRDKLYLGTYSHSYTDETQSIWNGIVGKMELQCFDKVYFKDIKIFTDIHNKRVNIKAHIMNETGNEGLGKLCVKASSHNSEKAHGPLPKEFDLNIAEGRNSFELQYEMGSDVLLWDEFSPSLYNLEVVINTELDGKLYKDERNIVFGMREFKVKDNHFVVNNRNVFLRGNLECCIHPLTGYPPVDIGEWTRIFKTVKEYGLNHIRFHSWCPPEAAFLAADKLGIYLQVEGPIWLDNWIIPVGAHAEHYKYIPEEAIRIIESFGNHPSFCMFSNGNELNGDFKLLHDTIDKLKEINPHILYTLTSNYDRELDTNDDYFVSVEASGKRIRGNAFKDIMGESTVLDYSEAVKLRDTVPIVSHEIGQFSVYPNINEISKYKGLLRPLNFEAIKNDLAQKNMLHRASDFTLASGKLALQLYKEEIEAALRTKDFGGVQLLGIQDFPGQCTATVGILDSFWESKGLTTGEEFSKFCGSIVPLLRLKKRIYKNSDDFSAEVEIAQFSPRDLNNVDINWQIETEDKDVLFNGSFSYLNIPTGFNSKIGFIENVSFQNLKKACKLTITVFVNSTEYKNSWDIWVYPDIEGETLEALAMRENILITSKLDTTSECALAKGGKVLLLPEEGSFVNKEIYPGKFFPVFWSPVFFASKDPCGIYCNDKHPVFDKFPTEFYSSYQWKSLLDNSISVSLDDLPANFKPIIEVVPNFFTNHRLSNLFEAKVGEGMLLVCSMDLKKLEASNVEARNLKYSILEYMSRGNFKPDQELSIEEVRRIFISEKEIEKIEEDTVREGFIKEDDL